MRKVFAVLLAAALFGCLLAGCGDSGSSGTSFNIAEAKSLADLKGAKIAAQAGTFHEEALKQIEDVKASTYPEFADLLTAVKSGAIDGYVAEEPTALTECLKDDQIGYLALKNNGTGFTATERQVGIAIGVQKGSELKGKISDVLETISEDTRYQLMLQMADINAGKTVDALVLSSETPAETNGVLKVAMECAYAPYNWTDLNEPTLGAVSIYGENGAVQEGRYANGYDVQIAKYVADQLGMELQVYAYAWDSLVPAVQSGVIDAIVAGMSPTEEREEQIDFSSMYYTSNLVIIYKK